MKYFVLDGKFKEDRPQGPAFKEALDAHHAYNAEFIAKGDVLACGPKPGGGGIMIIRAESQEAIEEYAANDPFIKLGVQEYDIKEFNVFAVHEGAAAWKVE